MKCVYTLFTKEGLLSNIGSYILLFIILYFAVSSILFYKVGYPLIENDIQSILFEKEKMNENNEQVSIYKIKPKPIYKKKKKKKIKKNKKSKFYPEYPPKKRKFITVKNLNSNKTNENNISQSKLKLKDVQILFNFQNRKEKKYKTSKNIKKTKNNKFSDKKPKTLEYINYSDYELNSLTYKEALEYDKRTFFQYYISLLKRKHPIIFSFIPTKDYNTMIIKLCLFFLFFSIYYSINTLFFNEATIHKIYEDEGSYNFGYLLPQILYSFVISHIFTTIIKFAFLSERNIMEIKREIVLQNAKEKFEKVKRNIIIKYIIFFVAGILFLIFFWYYLSSFGAVYQNSQIYLIKNTFISLAVGLLYPFIINIIPATLRICSLNDKNQNKEKLFKISKYLQFI